MSYKSTTEDWLRIESRTRYFPVHDQFVYRSLLELRSRIQAFESSNANHGNISRQPQEGQEKFISTSEPIPSSRLHSYSVDPAKPLEELGDGHTLVEAEPAKQVKQPSPRPPGDPLLLRAATEAIECAPASDTYEPEARAAIEAVSRRLLLFNHREAAQFLINSLKP